MGIVLWVSAGMIAFGVARIVPFARRASWLGEVFVSVSAAVLLGAVATALDFGGWREPDWRAGVFIFLGAFGACGLFRLVTMRRP
jgi:uncharacterized membrane protein SirB2